MDKHNILDNLPSDLTLEQFEPLVKTDAVLIERIVSAADVTPEGVNGYVQRQWACLEW
ncbi:hypothetical protein L2755_09995 [Shewanella abyssi]|uniref:hypothetical protein n=1 Tax=Shewanella abyssi TaxID=311789 RepID=UPI00200FB7EB|nr:hypothetical protein [Shewanella abyssi]MCL1049952.1 hypothetical protein [Shewanella abyssi]